MTLPHRLAAALLGLCAILALPAPADAQATSAGSITIAQPWARATPPGAKIGGGYFTLINNGDQTDRLVSLSTGISDRAEVHEMSMKDGIMSMRELADGLAVPAHGSVELKPGSFHVMFVGLKQPLKQGEHFPATLTFEKAGPVTVEFAIKSIGAMKPDP
ncbi:copper chaperone PCu(A)C [Methyloferula stellata]|uniref:copper chaperone PCu(A)C n=1 Tax=Methyloferula stellata TaxID=876270 RepID=UPI00037F20ED|nr:copper chaperone PCu(A)C [Methyloferula stellata]